MNTYAILEQPVHEATTDLSFKRGVQFAAFLERATHCRVVEASLSELAAGLNQLVKNGQVYYTCSDGTYTAIYGPSCEAVTQIAKQIPFWPENIASKIRKSVRQSQGAICSLALVDTDEKIDVFVTDWSSCTAACAIALHKYHWFSRRLNYRGTESNYFTGHYVRNPLTGDLMSVWVADWVKPDFGTGAVLVNPAHNQTDLEFARCVGLPIRFALSPVSEVDEYSLPMPPVLKTGYAIRTGFLDGKPASMVHNETINVLLGKGSARLHEDQRIAGNMIASFRQATPESADFFWCPIDGSFCQAPGEGVPVQVEFSACFKSAVTTVMHKPAYLQVNASLQKKNIGILAALIFDLGGKDAFVPLILLESVEYAGNRTNDLAIDLALLVGESPEKVLVIRRTLIDQIDSFLKGCGQLSSRLGTDGAQPPEQVWTELRKGDPVTAFRSLYVWQKQMIGNDDWIKRDVYLSILAIIGIQIQ